MCGKNSVERKKALKEREGTCRAAAGLSQAWRAADRRHKVMSGAGDRIGRSAI